MALISDGLLFLTALTTGLYCIVLARRLRRLGDPDEGIGGRIEALGAAIEETRAALSETRGRLEEMRRETQASSEKIVRDAGRAKRVADELAAATVAAERTLDSLYRAEMSGLSEVTPASAEASIEVVAVAPDPAPKEASELVPSRGSRAGDKARSESWSGDDVLKAERMTL